jgi:hypothetical protein
MMAAIDMLGKLQKNIIWRTSGFRVDNEYFEYFVEINKMAVDRITSIAARLQQENNTVSNLTCINWSGAIYPRSFGSDRIKGDHPEHYGLEARLVLIQMITNHLVTRQEDNKGMETELVPSIATKRPQRVFELPYEEQKGSWIGNHWVPPNGWRYFSSEELRSVYKDKSIMWVGDSLARLPALTMYGILNGTAANSRAAAIHRSVIDANKTQQTEFCAKWNHWCRTMPGGVGNYVHVVTNTFSDFRSFLVDEVSSKSSITENFNTIIIAMGNWDSVSPRDHPKKKEVIFFLI